MCDQIAQDADAEVRERRGKREDQNTRRRGGALLRGGRRVEPEQDRHGARGGGSEDLPGEGAAADQRERGVADHRCAAGDE